MKKCIRNKNRTQKKEPALSRVLQTRAKCWIIATFLVLMTTTVFADSEYYISRRNWAESLVASREAIAKVGTERKLQWALWLEIEKHYPIECDWMLQDMGVGENGNPDVILEWLASPDTSAINRMLDNVSAKIKVSSEASSAELVAALKKYHQKAESRRQRRLKIVYENAPQIVHVKHYNIGGSHYAYTEGQSDAQNERHFSPGGALCLLTVSPEGIKQEVLVDSEQGVIRDPDVSYDGKRILFAWKKGDRTDDYHLYEINVATREIKQITYGKGIADYEGIYLPDDDILFNSSRCVQTVDCYWTEVSNLYKCTADGKYLRRISFDQVHTNYPQVTDDGRVTYTRWDYNDRGQIYPQPLFVMNPDGTAQTEFYGNNSYFPTTILHARSIPGTQKVIAVMSGHHNDQRGKLAIIDPTKGRQEATGVQLIAPVRKTEPVKIDAYGQDGDQFQYPYPLSETQYITTYVPYHGGNHKYPRNYGLYLTNIDGSRELLSLDNSISSSQPVPLKPRTRPHLRPSMVDYSRDTGKYYVQDVYFGPGLKGVKRGTIKKLRVITIEFRAAGVRSNGNRGPAGGATVSTPVAVSNGSWDVKRVLGEAKVYKDGSAFFEVPAKTPVYFQMIDENGYVAQTMRSWSTLQPGEIFSCAGCHEDKSSIVPTSDKSVEALKVGAQKLTPFYGPPRGFSFPKEIQPILDKHCIKCHNDRENKRFANPNQEMSVGSSKEIVARESAWRWFSSDELNTDYRNTGFDDSGWPKAKGGFGNVNVELNAGTVNSHWPKRFLYLRKEFEMPQNYKRREIFFSVWNKGTARIFVNGQSFGSRNGNKNRYHSCVIAKRDEKWARAFKPGKNILMIECDEKADVRYIDVSLYQWKGPTPRKVNGQMNAFSLLGDGNYDHQAGRLWSDSYLTLTDSAVHSRPYKYRGENDGKITKWISVQSAPPMIAPYTSGSSKSKLMRMLKADHGKTKLSTEEFEKIACWIDLAVPYCGDYTEANIWNDGEIAKYERFQKKRDQLKELEDKNIAKLLLQSQKQN